MFTSLQIAALNRNLLRLQLLLQQIDYFNKLDSKERV